MRCHLLLLAVCTSGALNYDLARIKEETPDTHPCALEFGLLRSDIHALVPTGNCMHTVYTQFEMSMYPVHCDHDDFIQIARLYHHAIRCCLIVPEDGRKCIEIAHEQAPTLETHEWDIMRRHCRDIKGSNFAAHQSMRLMEYLIPFVKNSSVMMDDLVGLMGLINNVTQKATSIVTVWEDRTNRYVNASVLLPTVFMIINDISSLTDVPFPMLWCGSMISVMIMMIGCVSISPRVFVVLAILSALVHTRIYVLLDLWFSYNKVDQFIIMTMTWCCTLMTTNTLIALLRGIGCCYLCKPRCCYSDPPPIRITSMDVSAHTHCGCTPSSVPSSTHIPMARTATSQSNGEDEAQESDQIEGVLSNQSN